MTREVIRIGWKLDFQGEEFINLDAVLAGHCERLADWNCNDSEKSQPSMTIFKKWLERAAAKASCVNVGYNVGRLVHSFPANVPASSKALYTLTEGRKRVMPGIRTNPANP